MTLMDAAPPDLTRERRRRIIILTVVICVVLLIGLGCFFAIGRKNTSQTNSSMH